MRMILLFASAMMLASCTTPTMTAMNTGQQRGSGATTREEEPPVPAVFRRPGSTIKGWGSPGAGGMY